jgi:hypothetical protein
VTAAPPPGTPVGMMTDAELGYEIAGGSEDAAGELAARRQSRTLIRGIDPAAKLAAHHGASGKAAGRE